MVRIIDIGRNTVRVLTYTLFESNLGLSYYNMRSEGEAVTYQNMGRGMSCIWMDGSQIYSPQEHCPTSATMIPLELELVFHSARVNQH